MNDEHTDERVKTGVAGLDRVLRGGLIPGRIYLVDGEAGTGKTTLGLQFLMAGSAAGGRTLLLTLLQTHAELEAVVRSHGWGLEGISVRELPEEIRVAATTGQTVFEPADVELSEATEAMGQIIREVRPDYLFIDSLSELAALVDTGFQLKRQLLRLKAILDEVGCTTILTAGPSGGLDSRVLETLVHGVMRLEMRSPEFGRAQRRILVTKMRGMSFQEGYHDARLVTGGLEVFPRVEARGSVPKDLSEIRSGNAGIDALLGGGLREGTTCVLSGTSGAGKSILATLFAHTAVSDGRKAAVFCFDERRETFLLRSMSLGMPLEPLLDRGLLAVHQIDTGSILPAEFSEMVRRAVEEERARLVVIDSLTGYLQAMPGHRELTVQLHELLAYLSGAGVLTVMVVATHGLFADADDGIDVSYFADTVMLLRHFEARGEVRRCVAVIKKRYGFHERTIREVVFGPEGMSVGPPLHEFSGLLTGLPRFDGEQRRLFEGNEPSSSTGE